MNRNLTITRLVATTDLTLDKIGQRFGISRERVRQIALVNGVERGPRRLPDDKLYAAFALVKRGMPLAHAAETVGLEDRHALSSALKWRGLRDPQRAEPPWTDAEKSFLRKHYKQPGWSAADIADHLGRNRNEVIGQANRLQLCSPKYWPASKARTAKKIGKIAALRAKGLSHAQVAKRMQIPVGTVHWEWSRIKQADAP